MIVECSECSARFRLDDSKVSEQGVRVRCSKCRHIFVVKKEAQGEETDLDSLLRGLGGDEEEEAATPPSSAPAAASASAVAGDFGEEFFAPQGTAPVGAGPEDDDFFTAPSPAPAETAPAPSTPAGAFGFDDTSFDEGLFDAAAAASAATSVPSAGPDASGPDEFDFDSSFSSGTSSTEAAGGEEPGSFNVGEFDFDEEVPAPALGTAPSTPADFPEDGFSFDEEPLASPSAGAAPAASSAVDFTEEGFSFDEEPLPPGAGAPPGSQAAGSFPDDGFNFDDEFDASPAPAAEDSAAPAAAGFPDEGFSFDDEFADSPSTETSASPAPPASGFRDEAFSFDDDVAPAAEASAGVTAGTGEDDYPLDFGPGSDSLDAKDEEFTWDSAVVEPRPEAAEAPGGDTAFATSAGGAPAPAGRPRLEDIAADAGEAHEEPPPLAITSRHKGGGSALAGKLLAFLAVVGVGGAGYFFLQDMPGGGDSGTLEVRKVEGAFVTNPAGELFVVKGEAVNNRKKSAGPLRMKARILRPAGGVIAEKTAYCGNTIAPEQLPMLELSMIDSKLGTATKEVAPGGTAPCMVVFAGIPADAADFAAEIVQEPAKK